MANNTVWSIQMNMESGFEAAENTSSHFPFTSVMLGRDGRQFIREFTMPDMTMPYGCSGQVCKLYERYMYFNLKMNPLLTDSTESRSMWRDIFAKKMLTVAVGIKIVFRLYDFPNCPTDSFFLQMLSKHGQHFNSSNVHDMENRVYAIPGILHRMPMWHTAMKGEKMAFKLGLRGDELQSVTCMVELCELNLEYLDELMNFNKCLQHKNQVPLRDLTLCIGPKIKNKHVAAAAVLATITYLNIEHIPDPTDLLAIWTSSTNEYLQELNMHVRDMLNIMKM